MKTRKALYTLLTATSLLLCHTAGHARQAAATGPSVDSAAAVVSSARSAVAAVKPQTGWWWNRAEGGRGFTIEQQGNSIFMAGYLYDESGRATWYAAGPAPVVDSVFKAPLLSYAGGQTLNGSYRSPTGTTTHGNITVNFSDPSRATIDWAGGKVEIERYDIVPGGAAAPRAAGTPETGWWWNPQEGGRGYAIEIQNGTMFVAGYMYDEAGQPVWYASGPVAMRDSSTYEGSWNQYGGGQTLAGAYKPATMVNSNAGTVKLDFVSSRMAILTLPNGKKMPISRYEFACDAPAVLESGQCSVPGMLPAEPTPPVLLDYQAVAATLPENLYEFRNVVAADNSVILVRDATTLRDGRIRTRAEQWLNNGWKVNPGLDETLKSETSDGFSTMRFLSGGAWIPMDSYDLDLGNGSGMTYTLKVGGQTMATSLFEAKAVAGELLAQYPQLISPQYANSPLPRAGSRFLPGSVLYRNILRQLGDWITLSTSMCKPVNSLDALLADPASQAQFGVLLAANGMVQPAGMPGFGDIGTWRRGNEQGADLIQITSMMAEFPIVLASYGGQVCMGTNIPKGDRAGDYSTANQDAADSLTAALPMQ